MTLRIWACAVLVALLACATAQAAPVTVNLRVEGSSSTIFEGPVTTDGKQINKGGDTLVCDGTITPGIPGPGPTDHLGARRRRRSPDGIPWDGDVLQRLLRAAASPVRRSTRRPSLGATRSTTRPWRSAAASSRSAPGDEVLFAFDFFGDPPDFWSGRC